VFNILGILGISAIVYPFSLIETNAAVIPLEVTAMQFGQAASMVTWTDMGAIFLSVILLFVFAFTGRKVARWEGGILLAGYFLYMGLRFDLIPTFGG
jgi:cation:H+ antiporter